MAGGKRDAERGLPLGFTLPIGGKGGRLNVPHYPRSVLRLHQTVPALDPRFMARFFHTLSALTE